jgi:hypothetical protein
MKTVWAWRRETPPVYLHFVVSLAVGAVGLLGCDARFKCSSSAECGTGRVCMRIAPDPPSGDGSECVVPCSNFAASSPECPDAGQCFCNDSPAGSRCTNVDTPEKKFGNFYCGT